MNLPRQPPTATEQSAGPWVDEIVLEPRGRGLHEITDQVAEIVEGAAIARGLCTLFLRHTSASLIVQENADPSARRDLEAFFDRLVPEGDALYSHTAEGPDDMPAHVKAVLSATSLAIPILDSRLALGVWQGIFLWEHRRQRLRRHLVVHVA
ncbi:MAG: secondary thiamine-phosphate synthase enzyme YjbQ [Acidobacteriota bacterium]